VYNVPASVRGLPEAVPAREELSDGTRQLRNDAGRTGYTGPMPPPGKVHHYNFQLYALDRHIDPVNDKQQLLNAMGGHTLAQARLTGLYER
jgi:Raf kinase inhibitor-like YbhB/YbcL family protein